MSLARWESWLMSAFTSLIRSWVKGSSASFSSRFSRCLFGLNLGAFSEDGNDAFSCIIVGFVELAWSREERWKDVAAAAATGDCIVCGTSSSSAIPDSFAFTCFRPGKVVLFYQSNFFLSSPFGSAANWFIELKCYFLCCRLPEGNQLKVVESHAMPVGLCIGMLHPWR